MEFLTPEPLLPAQPGLLSRPTYANAAAPAPVNTKKKNKGKGVGTAAQVAASNKPVTSERGAALLPAAD